MRPTLEHLACVSPAPINLSTRQSFSFEEFQKQQQQELLRLEIFRRREEFEHYRRYYEEITTFPAEPSAIPLGFNNVSKIESCFSRDLHLRGKPYMIEQILKSKVPSNKTQ